jgi:hypothetical protein
MHGTIHVILPVGGIVRESAIAVIAIVSASHGFEYFFSNNARLTVFVCLDNKLCANQSGNFEGKGS